MVSAEDIDATAIDLTISDEDDLEDDNEFYKAKPQRSSNSTSLLPAARGEREARDNEHRHAMWNQALRRYKQKPIVASTGFTTNHESTKSSDPRVTKAPSNPSTSAPGLANYNRSSAQPHKDGRAVSRPQDPHDIPLKQDKVGATFSHSIIRSVLAANMSRISIVQDGKGLLKFPALP